MRTSRRPGWPRPTGRRIRAARLGWRLANPDLRLESVRSVIDRTPGAAADATGGAADCTYIADRDLFTAPVHRSRCPARSRPTWPARTGRRDRPGDIVEGAIEARAGPSSMAAPRPVDSMSGGPLGRDIGDPDLELHEQLVGRRPAVDAQTRDGPARRPWSSPVESLTWTMPSRSRQVGGCRTSREAGDGPPRVGIPVRRSNPARARGRRRLPRSTRPDARGSRSRRLDEAEPVPQPLHGRPGDEGAAFERVRGLSAGAPGRRGHETVPAHQGPLADVHQREGARAVVLRVALLKARLPEGRPAGRPRCRLWECPSGKKPAPAVRPTTSALPTMRGSTAPGTLNSLHNSGSPLGPSEVHEAACATRSSRRWRGPRHRP